MGHSPEPVRAFVSHAREDMDSFTREFVRRLRASGVVAWVDESEILLGDDLTERVFEDGLQQAQVIFVILSKAYLAKAFPRLELSVAVIRKLYHNVRIIPVLIENDVEVPVSLQSTVWVKMTDPMDYDKEYAQILQSLYGEYNRSPLGPPPVYARLGIDHLPGLQVTDTAYLQLIFRDAVDNATFTLRPTSLQFLANQLELSAELAMESLEALEKCGIIRGLWPLGLSYPTATLTSHGIQLCMRNFVPDSSRLLDEVLLACVNQEYARASLLSEQLGRDFMHVCFAMEMLTSRGLMRANHLADDFYVYEVTVTGRRYTRTLGQGSPDRAS